MSRQSAVQSIASPLYLVFGALALAAAGVGVVVTPKEAWAGMLVAGVLGLFVSVGAGFFAAINVVSGARWTHGLQPAVHAVARVGILPSLLLLAVFSLGIDELYPWAHHAVGESHPLLDLKAPWLNKPFFLGRAFLLLAVFWVATRVLVSKARPSPRLAAGYLVVTAVGICVASWDWLMSLEPEWFSTMYGVYGFSGALLSGIAATTVVAFKGNKIPGGHTMSESQRHDLGRLLFGFSMFWAYIWFCQYMLIWYANLPEETSYFALRMHGEWVGLFWLNPVVSFVIPFVLLLSARAKKNPQLLFQVAVLILAGRWLDIYLMVAPPTMPNESFPWFAMVSAVVVLLGSIYWISRELPKSAERVYP